MDDVETMSIKELKALIKSAGLSDAGIIDKPGLREKAKEAQARLAERKARDAKAKPTPVNPSYVYQEAPQATVGQRVYVPMKYGGGRGVIKSVEGDQVAVRRDGTDYEVRGAFKDFTPEDPKDFPKRPPPPTKEAKKDAKKAKKPSSKPASKKRKKAADEWDSDASESEEEAPPESESEPEEPPLETDEEEASSSDSEPARSPSPPPAKKTGYILWISTGQSHLGEDEEIVGIYKDYKRCMARAKKILDEGFKGDDFWCMEENGGYREQNEDDFEDYTGLDAPVKGSRKVAAAAHGEGCYGNMAMWCQKIPLP
mmetsp:Transcript_23312/g.69811  ORF Transcript_23312/g.69811 Transcript_23312/m.69811 type:complete len:313 (-) Transcript_23312:39-977(-)